MSYLSAGSSVLVALMLTGEAIALGAILAEVLSICSLDAIVRRRAIADGFNSASSHGERHGTRDTART